MRSIIVVGAALAGLSAARALRTQGYDGSIELVGAEHHLPYDRPPLSKEFLLGTVPAGEIALHTEDDDALDLRWRLGTTAVHLDRSGRGVALHTGETLPADGVVIATGARPRTLPHPDGLAGVHLLRTLDDAVALRETLLRGGNLVVVGAGFIGAEVASAARTLGATVTVVEAAPAPLVGALGTAMAQVVAGLHADHGVRLLTGAGVDSLIGTDRIEAVRLSDGSELPADAVVVGVGAAPNVEWLAGSGLELANGVVTDAACATSIPGVVAVGDCAAAHNVHAGRSLRVEHWTNALDQPATAVATLLSGNGTRQPYTAAPYFWSDQYGIRLQFAGHCESTDTVRVVEGDTDSRCFLAVYEREGRMVAVLAMNQPRSFTRLRRQLSAPIPV
jgi:NADPH-dependent 2,4-dienoyl-CoA reductase/sulfur reductase-like enzyme